MSKMPTVYHWPDRNVYCLVIDGSNRMSGVDYEPRPRQRRRDYVDYLWWETKPTFFKLRQVTPAAVTHYTLDDERKAAPPFAWPKELTPEQWNALSEDERNLYTGSYTDGVWERDDVEYSLIELSNEPGLLPEGWQSILPHAAMIEPVCQASAPCYLPALNLLNELCKYAKQHVKETPGLEANDSSNIGGFRIETVLGVRVGAGQKQRERVTVLTICTRRYKNEYSVLTAGYCIVVEDLYAPNAAEGLRKLEELKRQIALVKPVKICHCCGGHGFVAAD